MSCVGGDLIDKLYIFIDVGAWWQDNLSVRIVVVCPTKIQTGELVGDEASARLF